jgi:hypothetical protein
VDASFSDADTTLTPITSTPSTSRKRRRTGADAEEPAWMEEYRAHQYSMHQERMEIESRRVLALESLVKLMQDKEDKDKE